MTFREALPQYSDGSPMSLGDELEVCYPDIRPIPHRGLICRFVRGSLGITDIEIIHNSKSAGGVCVVNFRDFAQGQQVRLRRRPLSGEHSVAILRRASAACGHPYELTSNCEHFTDWCYNGVRGESPTLQAAVVGITILVIGFAALSGDHS